MAFNDLLISYWYIS